MRSKKILIVEDDNDIHRMLKDLLHQHDYQTESSYSGTEALRLFESERFDLMLLDLMLPGLSGEELLGKIRNKSPMPIIAISAKQDKETTVKLLKMGADDYIVKPFYPEELIARIELRLRQPVVNEQTNILSYNEITIDLDMHQATINGREMNLTPREFLILELFIRYPHKVFSKANLYETVWGNEFLGDDNTVNVHISKLRNKIKERLPEANYIQTVWGVGFKFD